MAPRTIFPDDERMHGTLEGALGAAVAEHAPRTAIHTVDERLTYSELDRRIADVAASMPPNLHAGARTGLLLPNVPAFVVALHAILRSGGGAVLINPLSSPREVAEIVDDAAVGTVVTADGLESLLPPGVRRVRVDRETGRVLQTATRPEAGSRSAGTARGENDRTAAWPGSGDEPDPPPRGAARWNGPADESVVIYTAATDGRARGAVLTGANLTANARATVEALGLTASDRVAAVLPLSHAFGLTVCLNAPLSVGAAVVPVERFAPGTLLELLRREEITVLAGVPSIFGALLEAAEKQRAIAHSLRVTLCGGAPMPLDLGRRWERAFGVPLRQGYGLTEASPVCTFNRVDRPNRPGTLGSPLSGVEVGVRDPDGLELPEGEVGELCIRGPNVFQGYLDGRDTGVFLGGGWLRTGDLGSVTGGVVRFHGTVKPMFTRKGFNVYPAEIRRVLMESPEIADAVVYGRTDVAREYEIVLDVRPVRPGGLTAESVREICRSKLARYKQPTEIRIVG